MRPLILLMLVIAAPFAIAGPILQPVSVTANGGISPPDPIIDQSGLAAPYVSGVTDFDSYVAATQASFITIAGQLGDTAPPPTGTWVFDLGSVFSVDGAGIWNQSGTASLDQFSLEASLDAIFTTPIALGSFAMSIFRGANPINADVFSFGSVDARYIRLNVVSNAGYETVTRINEIAFRQSDVTVPEPTTLLLLGFGLAGLGFTRRRLH